MLCGIKVIYWIPCLANAKNILTIHSVRACIVGHNGLCCHCTSFAFLTAPILEGTKGRIGVAAYDLWGDCNKRGKSNGHASLLKCFQFSKPTPHDSSESIPEFACLWVLRSSADRKRTHSIGAKQTPITEDCKLSSWKHPEVDASNPVETLTMRLLAKLKTRISKGSAWSWKHSLWILMMQRSLQVEWHWPPVPFPKVQLQHFAPEKDCLSAQTSVTQPVNMWHVSSAGSVLVESSNNCQNCLAKIVWRRSSLLRCAVISYIQYYVLQVVSVQSRHSVIGTQIKLRWPRSPQTRWNMPQSHKTGLT